jgi:hypothetical protein
VYIVGRRLDGRERRVVGCGCCEVRRRAERDIACGEEWRTRADVVLW